jgi:hypothetical protein
VNRREQYATAWLRAGTFATLQRKAWGVLQVKRLPNWDLRSFRTLQSKAATTVDFGVGALRRYTRNITGMVVARENGTREPPRWPAGKMEEENAQAKAEAARTK